MDQLCTTDGCVSEIVDDLAETTYTFAATDRFAGNFYYASKSRTLTNIELYLSPASDVSLDWLVYESLTIGGPYEVISTTTTSENIESGKYVASGPVEVALVSGRYYAIGAYVEGTPSGFFTYHSALVSVSFGQQFDVAIVQSPSAPPETLTFTASIPKKFIRQRLTTGAP
jgi:hypothetical protein